VRYSILVTTLLLSMTILPTVAQSQTMPAESRLNAAAHPSTLNQTSPFNLAHLAYQGYLKDQGVPEAGALMNAIASGTLTAQNIMQAAVKVNRLSEKTLSDRGYRHQLEVQLNGLMED
jgi:hypothetical protein